MKSKFWVTFANYCVQRAQNLSKARSILPRILRKKASHRLILAAYQSLAKAAGEAPYNLDERALELSHQLRPQPHESKDFISLAEEEEEAVLSTSRQAPLLTPQVTTLTRVSHRALG